MSRAFLILDFPIKKLDIEITLQLIVTIVLGEKKLEKCLCDASLFRPNFFITNTYCIRGYIINKCWHLQGESVWLKTTLQIVSFTLQIWQTVTCHHLLCKIKFLKKRTTGIIKAIELSNRERKFYTRHSTNFYIQPTQLRVWSRLGEVSRWNMRPLGHLWSFVPRIWTGWAPSWYQRKNRSIWKFRATGKHIINNFIHPFGSITISFCDNKLSNLQHCKIEASDKAFFMAK